MDVNRVTIELFRENEEDLKKVILKDWNKIPSLNANDAHNLQDERLVRFKGMVQDMYDPEFYFSKFEVINTESFETYMRNGKYTDGFLPNDKEEVNNESRKNVLAERQTFVVISIPGVNKWAEDLEMKSNKIFKNSSSSPLKMNKRLAEDMVMEELAESSNSSDSPLPSTSSKKQCTNNSSSEVKTPLISQEYLLNFPLPNRSGKACQFKVYNKWDEIKLNDIIECVGFLSVNPSLTCEAEDSEEFDAMEMQTHHPPPSLIPRIHCVEIKKIENGVQYFDKNIAVSAESAQFLRKELHIVLTQVLLGDELAAEYLIYHLISRVYLRKELMALGKFSLNLSNIPGTEIPDYGEQLYKFIEEFIPKSHYLPMTLENMNDLTFIPKKDYECNRISSGLLQLSANTHLVLDETKLTAGKLEASGVQALTVISNVVKNQNLVYDFNYYKMDFDCDIPFLILSEGKSMIPTDSHVRLQPSEICVNTFNEIIKAAKLFLKPELLDGIRHYLATRRHAEYDLSDNVQKMIETDFVAMRQRGGTTPEDLHNLLVLARLVCLAEGKNELDEACWKRACQLEADRKSRITN